MSRAFGGLALLVAVALTGCGSSRPGPAASTTESVPAFASAPYTPQQERVEQGAKLVVADGCSACHLNSADRRLAPSFTSLAGHRVRLSDGRTALVDERFLRETLLHPGSNGIAGYAPEPMIAALTRLDLARRPADVADLVSFIEQVGPETE